MTYILDLFGDELAKRQKYKANDGIEAVQFYLMQKHGWTPSTVKSMSFEDLKFAISEEMHGWTISEA